MVPPLIFDISSIDMGRVQHDTASVESVNPHRGDMRMLDGVVHINDECNEAVAFKVVGAEEFWVAGHIPGRPLLPGVLMLEAAAQLASYMTIRRLGGEVENPFLGFVGAEGVKFRSQVQPGSRLFILGKLTKWRRRQSTYMTQGLVDGNLVFEATIQGMLI